MNFTTLIMNNVSFKISTVQYYSSGQHLTQATIVCTFRNVLYSGGLTYVRERGWNNGWVKLMPCLHKVSIYWINYTLIYCCERVWTQLVSKNTCGTGDSPWNLSFGDEPVQVTFTINNADVPVFPSTWEDEKIPSEIEDHFYVKIVRVTVLFV